MLHLQLFFNAFFFTCIYTHTYIFVCHLKHGREPIKDDDEINFATHTEEQVNH